MYGKRGSWKISIEGIQKWPKYLASYRGFLLSPLSTNCCDHFGQLFGNIGLLFILTSSHTLVNEKPTHIPLLPRFRIRFLLPWQCRRLGPKFGQVGLEEFPTLSTENFNSLVSLLHMVSGFDMLVQWTVWSVAINYKLNPEFHWLRQIATTLCKFHWQFWIIFWMQSPKLKDKFMIL